MATVWPIVPVPDDGDDDDKDDDDDGCGAIGGMRIGRRHRSTRRKPTLVPLCPPQIPHDLTRARSWRLTRLSYGTACRGTRVLILTGGDVERALKRFFPSFSHYYNFLESSTTYRLQSPFFITGLLCMLDKYHTILTVIISSSYWFGHVCFRPQQFSCSNPGSVKNFLHDVQTGSGAHRTSYSMGTVGSFSGVKRPGREADHSPPASAEVKKMWIYISTPTYAFMAQCLIS
jgi:hypothetical protein